MSPWTCERLDQVWSGAWIISLAWAPDHGLGTESLLGGRVVELICYLVESFRKVFLLKKKTYGRHEWRRWHDTWVCQGGRRNRLIAGDGGHQVWCDPPWWGEHRYKLTTELAWSIFLSLQFVRLVSFFYWRKICRTNGLFLHENRISSCRQEKFREMDYWEISLPLPVEEVTL